MSAPITSFEDGWLYDRVLRRPMLTAIVISVAYFLAANIGFKFVLQPGSVSVLWMPNALILAGLLLVPRSSWWLIVAMALPAHLVSQWLNGAEVARALSLFASNTTQAMIGAVAIDHFVPDELRFDRIRDVKVFLLYGVFVAPFVASFIDVGLVRQNSPMDPEFWPMWRVRFFSNVLASLTLTPTVINWARYWGVRRKTSPKRYLEAAVLTLGLFVAGFFIFNMEHDTTRGAPITYWSFPFLLWAAGRFGPRGVTTALLLVMFLAIAGVGSGTGPFITGSVEASALSIQLFLIVTSIPLMVLAAVIEERRRAESAARANEERLTLALGAAQMDTWEWKTADSKLTWSESKKAHGAAAAAGNGIVAEENTIHPEDKKNVESAIAHALSDGGACEVEFRIVRNGSARWFMSKGKVVHDELGQPVGMLGIGMDITGRKQAQQALFEITSRNQAILRALPDMIFLIDKSGVYRDFHTRNSAQLLIPPESFLGKSVREVLPPDLAERVMHSMKQLTSGAEPQVLEYSLPIAGQERYFEARLVTADSDHVLSIVRDVTSERRAVHAARKSQQELLQSNKEIRDLAARLITAQESERRRISLLLHDDVNQNIAVMGLGISRLKSITPPSNEEVMTGLGELAEQAHNLTTQIRDLSHHLHPGILEHLGLVAALKSHVAELKHEGIIDATFTARVGPEPIAPDVAVCVYRVALEALHNASRHSGAALAKVDLREVDGFLTLEVSDSGRGFNVENARLGSGIGLASSEERVRLLRGSFDVRSSPESGTVVSARVPRAGP